MRTYDYLLSFNVKPSVQRLAIMDYLLTHRTHPSIEEIYLALCDDIPTLSKTAESAEVSKESRIIVLISASVQR